MTTNKTCKHCGISMAWDEPLTEWFHVEDPSRGEDAIYCPGTERLGEPVGAVAVYANETEDGGYGDIYRTPEEVTADHPGATVLHGWTVEGDDTDMYVAVGY